MRAPYPILLRTHSKPKITPAACMAISVNASGSNCPALLASRAKLQALHQVPSRLLLRAPFPTPPRTHCKSKITLAACMAISVASGSKYLALLASRAKLQVIHQVPSRLPLRAPYPTSPRTHCKPKITPAACMAISVGTSGSNYLALLASRAKLQVIHQVLSKLLLRAPYPTPPRAHCKSKITPAACMAISANASGSNYLALLASRAELQDLHLSPFSSHLVTAFDAKHRLHPPTTPHHPPTSRHRHHPPTTRHRHHPPTSRHRHHPPTTRHRHNPPTT